MRKSVFVVALLLIVLMPPGESAASGCCPSGNVIPQSQCGPVCLPNPTSWLPYDCQGLPPKFRAWIFGGVQSMTLEVDYRFPTNPVIASLPSKLDANTQTGLAGFGVKYYMDSCWHVFFIGAFNGSPEFQASTPLEPAFAGQERVVWAGSSFSSFRLASGVGYSPFSGIPGWRNLSFLAGLGYDGVGFNLGDPRTATGTRIPNTLSYTGNFSSSLLIPFVGMKVNDTFIGGHALFGPCTGNTELGLRSYVDFAPLQIATAYNYSLNKPGIMFDGQLDCTVRPRPNIAVTLWGAVNIIAIHAQADLKVNISGAPVIPQQLPGHTSAVDRRLLSAGLSAALSF